MPEPVQDNSESSVQPDMDKIIARIQKMLTRTKTDRGSTEAEADTAMKMAQELMSKYNLDMAMVEAAASKSDQPKVERVKEEVKGRAMYKWQRQLAKYVAESNFCYYLTRSVQEWQDSKYELDSEWLDDKGKPTGDAKDMKKRITRDERDALAYEQRDMYHYGQNGRYQTTHSHLFVGRTGNVITAQLMYQYLTQTIEDNVPVASNAERLSRSAMSWKEGCADRLCERLSKRRQDLIKAHDVRVKQEAADARAEFERRQAAEQAKAPKQLGADRNTEVKEHFNNAAAGAYDRSGEVPEAEEQDRPDVDEDDEIWTPQGEVQPEPETGSALVLASVYDDHEREANYEVAHGLELGQLARWRAEADAAREAKAAVEAKQEANDIEQPVKAETERQRKSREKRESEQQRKNRARWARESLADERREQRQWEKRDHRSYRAGAEKGKDIGLDSQVGAGKEPNKLK